MVEAREDAAPVGCDAKMAAVALERRFGPARPWERARARPSLGPPREVAPKGRSDSLFQVD